MLLVEITINGTLHRVSNDDYALTHLWKSEIATCDSFQIKFESKTGGYAKPSYGSITFLPTLFVNDWLPPVSCPITVKYAESVEEDAVTLFDGTAHLQAITRTGIQYRFYQSEYDVSVDGQLFNDTLLNVVTWCCDAARLNLTVDSSGTDRAASVSVKHTTGDVVLIDELSRICAFFSHYFYITDGTLYLCDTMATGTARQISEFDVLPVEYEWPTPYSKFKSDDYSVDGSHSYGTESSWSPYHDTQSNIENALVDIQAVMELPEAVYKYPDMGSAPSIGSFETLLDESLEADKNTTLLVTELTYDFDSETCVARGLAVTNLWIDTDIWDDSGIWAD